MAAGSISYLRVYIQLFFPKQGEVVGSDERVKRINGKLLLLLVWEIHAGCLHLQSVVLYRTRSETCQYSHSNFYTSANTNNTPRTP